jgi:hypothetical protein
MTDLFPFIWPARMFAPEDEGAGGTQTTGDTGTAEATAAAGETGTAEATAAAGETAKQTPAPGGAWWEAERFSAERKNQFKALGLTVDDPMDAIERLGDMELAAKRKLGKGPENLMDRPAKDQPVADWLKANREVLGIPETADAYKITRPESVPEESWDQKLLVQAQERGHALGLSNEQMQGMVAFHAENVANLLGGAETQLAQANAAMRQELTADWGAQTEAKMAQAAQAARSVAEAAGLDPDALANVTMLLSAKTGDANTLRLFAAIAEGMADDKGLVLKGGDSPGLGMTPANARAEIAAMMQPDSPYRKAISDKRAGKSTPDFDKLQTKFSELQRIANPV